MKIQEQKTKLTYSMQPLAQGWEQWLFMHRRQHRKESRVRSFKPFPHVFQGQHNRAPKLDKDNNETLQANFSHEHKVKLQTNMNRSNPVIKCGLF